MAVYPVCKECRTRREHCVDVSAHKRFVGWRADVQFTRESDRLRKTFRTQESAEIQERQWYTDYERDVLVPNKKLVRRTFAEVADEWLSNISRQGRNHNAIRSERYRINTFKEAFGKKIISQLGFQDGEDLLNSRLENKRAIGTINREIVTLKSIVSYALKKKYLTESPFAGLIKLKGATIRCRWMTETEIQLLVKACLKLKDMALIDVISLGINTGFRKGNLERLAARDISSNRITAVKTKSGSPYYVPTTTSIVPALRRLIALHPTGPLLDTRKLDRRFRLVAKAAGLYKEKGNEENVTIHTLRHTFAALYLNRGGDIYKLHKLLGHASVAITEKVYGHLCPSVLDAQAPLMNTNIETSLQSETQAAIRAL